MHVTTLEPTAQEATTDVAWDVTPNDVTSEDVASALQQLEQEANALGITFEPMPEPVVEYQPRTYEARSLSC